MTTITYICAIRYHQPVWAIEHLRKCLNYANNRDDMMHHCGVHYNAADALKFAVMYDHLEYAKFLLVNHLVEALDTNLCCPVLLLAVQHGCKEMVEMLCSYANSNNILHKGRPYIDACGCEAMENKKTPLHISVQLGQVEITKVLLQHGANTAVKDKSGMTPLERLVHQELNAINMHHGWNIEDNERHIRQDRPTRFTLPRNRSRSRSPVSRSSSSLSDEPRFRANDRSQQCIDELLKCETSLPQHLMDNLQQLYQKRYGDSSEEMIHLASPFSLLHHARAAIRSALGRHHLPSAIHDIGLPPRLQQYVDLVDVQISIS